VESGGGIGGDRRDSGEGGENDVLEVHGEIQVIES
jgi:hypothetical protein